MSTPSYGTESDENALYTANVIANPKITDRRRRGRCHGDHAGVPAGHAAGSRRRRGQCRDRLPRHRVPALGAGPQRHRAGRRRASCHRFRYGQLHERQLRSPRAYLKAASDLLVTDLEEMVANWSEGGAARAELADARRPGDPHRHGLAVLRRSRGRAHEARPPAARSGRGARLLLGQHPHQPPLRRGRRAERLSRQAIAAVDGSGGRGPVGLPSSIARQGSGARHRDRGAARRHRRQDGGDGDARRDASRPTTR